MAKLFGEFLMEKNIVNMDQLVECLIKQMHSMKTPAEICQEREILNSQELLSVFKRQHELGADFFVAYRETDFYEEDREKNLRKILMEGRKPIGQIIVEENILSYVELAKILDEYLSKEHKETPKVEKPSAVSESAPGETTSTTTKIDEDAKEELLMCFDDQKKDSLFNSIDFILTAPVESQVLKEEVFKKVSDSIVEAKALFAVFEVRECIPWFEYLESQFLLNLISDDRDEVVIEKSKRILTATFEYIHKLIGDLENNTSEAAKLRPSIDEIL